MNRACRFCSWLLLLTLCSWQSPVRGADSFPLNAQRILFLGDSITHAGHYVARVEAHLRMAGVDPLPELINLGLPSETASGLSEEGHPFPRPTVHTRLDRALEKARPDVAVVCYGMNDGIYHPLNAQRFEAYREGINRIIEKSRAAGVQVILLTPPPFDPRPLRASGKLQPEGGESFGFGSMYAGYDDVLAAYADWILEQKERVAMVIDIRSPLLEEAAARRQQNPDFTFTPDGVHPTPEGHRIIAETILKAWGVKTSPEPPDELLQQVTRRQTLLHNAWLSHVGHERPGMQPGLPLEEARAEAERLERKMAP